MRLHHGVFCKRSFAEPGSSTQTWKKTLPGDTVLLVDIVDALGAVFHLLVEFVRSLRNVQGSNHASILSPGSKASEYGREAIEHVDQARDQLIRELHGRQNTDMIGPVVTPEAITITLMQRLVSGTFREGNIDVISLYEACLEHLVQETLRLAYTMS